ncbi:MlaD family protein [Pseudonocardia sp. H11422]|uniref:MlaD family protein n=1 Tax=Pseudonocardia sp. H11422 TaxID=2835866 RepID=UPI001BDD8C2B|nr:MlaD family protein [Pseudonocardia sp. H11422]
MKISAARLPAFRLAMVLAFVLSCAVFFAYLWSQGGGFVAGLSQARSYHVSVDVPNVRNLAPFSDVQMAGVAVGNVKSIERTGDQLRLELWLDDVAVPLHDGVRVQVSEKSLVGQYYVKLVDGQGPPLPDGTVLPEAAVIPPVDLRDVLASLDAPTREDLGGLIRSLGTSTDGRARDISALMSGLADLGHNGNTAVDAIAAQSGDLELLVSELETLFTTLDTGEGQVVQLVHDANRITAATAGQREAIEGAVRQLPGVLASTSTATGHLTELSGALAPVAADLRKAAPDLDAALVELPATTRDLRGLLPSLEGTLDRAPATLDRVPVVTEQARALIPPATDLLRDLNPALRYLEPYGKDLSQVVTVFGAAFHQYGDRGNTFLHVQAVQNPYALTPNPLNLPPGLLAGSNPYPEPGGLADRKPLSRDFPRLEPDR